MLHHKTYIKDNNSEWVTFIHGAGGSSSVWFKQVREFRKHFNVLLIDLRGHGKSEASNPSSSEQYHFKTIAQEVVDVLDHLGINQSHFIGVSLGTIIIREISERYPQRTNSLVLTGAIMKLNFTSRLLLQIGHWLKNIIPYMLLYRIFAFIVMPHRTQRESRKIFIREARKMVQREFIRWFSLTKDIDRLLFKFRSKDSGKQTLYIMGEQDFMFLSPIQELVKRYSASTLKVIPNCGHVVNIQEDQIFNRLSINFLRAQ